MSDEATMNSRKIRLAAAVLAASSLLPANGKPGSARASEIRPVCPALVAGSADTEFNVTIETAEVANLFGVSFQLDFDPSCLQVLSESAGPFLGEDVIFFPQRDNLNGHESIGISRKYGQGGVHGTGNAALIRFKVLQDVTQNVILPFALSSVTSNDPAGNPILLSTAPDTTVLASVTLHPVAPPVFHMTAGNSFDVQLEVRNAFDLFGVSFQLKYDPLVLTADSDSAGPFLGNDVVYMAVQDDTAGTVSVGVSRKAGQSGSTGTGILATIRFAVNHDRTDTTRFTVSKITAFDRERRPVLIAPDSCTTLVISGIGDHAGMPLPDGYCLYPNHPNPFNPSTTIRYALPCPAEVVVTISDAMGREIQVLDRGRKGAGIHELSFRTSGLPSGPYFCRLRAGVHVLTRSMMLVR
jgi:hypothetical protein